jgi:hypothetical protein
MQRRSTISPWTKTTVLVPIAFSVLATVVSAFAYVDQHTTNSETLAAAALASEQQYARQVAFWTNDGKGIRVPVLMVENLGSAPIANAKLTLRITLPSTVAGAYAEQSFDLGVIPPCTISSTVMTNLRGAFGESAAHLYLTGPLWNFESWLNFTDSAGKSWQRNGDGSLRELVDIPAMPAVVWLHSTYQSTATCS